MAMTQSVRRRLQLRTIIFVTALAIIGGAAYGVSLGFTSWIAALRGATTAIVITLPVLLFEIYIANGQMGTSVRRGPLWRWIVIKTVFYVGAVVLGETLTWLLFSEVFGLQESSYLEGMRATIVFSMPAAAVINVFFIVRQMLGAGVMMNLLLGRYHRPREETLIFVFIDLVGSTAFGEKLGAVRFYELLNRFVLDVSASVTEQHGRIYRYVGDEVIAVWPLLDPRDGAHNARNRMLNGRCIAAWRDASVRLEHRAAQYLRDFGVAPHVRCAIHAGTVVTGEMGDIKREITYLGDTVNTTARIEAACKAYDADCLASDVFLESAMLPDGIIREKLGAIPLAGKVADLAVSRLTIDPANAR